MTQEQRKALGEMLYRIASGHTVDRIDYEHRLHAAEIVLRYFPPDAPPLTRPEPTSVPGPGVYRSPG